MKLIVLFMTVAIMGASAKGTSQSVTFSGKDIALEKVFSAIRNQTGYRIFADRQLLEEAGNVSIVAKQLQLTEFLDLLFRNKPLEYMIKEQTIFIRKKEKPVQMEKLTIRVPAPPFRGRIATAAGLPLQGATVSVRGQSKSTTTDQNGEFFLSLDEGDIIQISFVGYETIMHRITRQEKELLTFVMHPVVSKLEEVTVNMTTGYQRIPKERATGAFSMISEKALERRVAPNLLTLMEGMAPGLVMQYTAHGLEDSKDPNVMIRGVSTFGSTQPLIVVDGFPIEGNISNINPNDVANITILKDAAAASIWGVKASNGVIVIETKRGKTIKPQVTLRSNYEITSKPSLDYMNKAGSADMIDLEKEIFGKSGGDRATYEAMGTVYTKVYDILFKHQEGTITDAERDAQLAELAAYDNRKDAAKEFFANNYLFNNTISFSGAPQSNFNYYGSLGYMDGTGIYKGDKQRQANVNFNAEVKLNQKLKLNMGLNYTEENGAVSPLVHFSDLGVGIPYSMLMLPYERLRNADGTAASIDRKYNNVKKEELAGLGFYNMNYYPLNDIGDYEFKRRNNNVRLQSFLHYKFNNSISFQGGYKIERISSHASDLYTEGGFETRNMLNRFAEMDASGKLKFNLPKGDFIQEENGRTNNFYVRAQMDIDHQFRNSPSHIAVVLGTEWQRSEVERSTDTRFGYGRSNGLSFPIDQFKLFTYYNDLLEEDGRFEYDRFYNKQLLDDRYISYYFNGAYTYKGRYTLSSSMRMNKSSRFDQSSGLDKNVLGSAGAKWAIHKEAFLKNVEWLDQLSLRYTLGLTGNVPNYASSSLRTSAYTALSGTGTFMLTALSPANRHLKWESSLTHNIGLDLGLWRGRVEATLELYHKKTNNMLAPQIIDPTLVGKYYVYKNLADVTNKGIELQLNTINIKSRNINWYSTLTASYNSNRINRSDNRRDQAVGYPVSITDYDAGSLFAYRWAGLSNTGTPQFYYTEDGKDKITTSVNNLLFKDFRHMGTVIPRYNMGLSNTLNYREWSFSFMFIYSGGNILHTDAYNEYNAAYATGDLIFNNVPAAVKDRWRAEGDEARTNVPAYGKGALGYNNADINYQSADFIKLRDVVLSYSVKKRSYSWLPLESIQLRFQARNIWKWVANDAGIDPEAYVLDKGLRTLPVTASYNFGISATF